MIFALALGGLILGAVPGAVSQHTLREQARAVIEVHCGPCHDPGSGYSQPDALAIYDLVDVAWAGRLSIAQLKDLVVRMKGRQTMTDDELKYVLPHQLPPPARPTDAEVQVLAAYVEAELAARSAR